MTILEIVEKYLKENEFDGLCNSNSQCACKLDDLMPCECEYVGECSPGYLVECTCGEHEFVISEDKGASCDEIFD